MNRSTVAAAALATAAFACLALNPAQGRLTQGSAAAPAPRVQTLASAQTLVARQPWSSSPIDTRGYHSLTLCVGSPDTTYVDVHLVVRNDPSEPWCFVGPYPRPKSIALRPRVGEQVIPGSGQCVVISDLHYAEVALVFEANSNNPPTFTLNASVYLE